MGYEMRGGYSIYILEESLWVTVPYWSHFIIYQISGFITGSGESSKSTCLMNSDTQWHNIGKKQGPVRKEQKQYQVSYTREEHGGIGS